MNHTTAYHLIQKFQEADSVEDAKRCGRPKTANNEDNSITTLAVFERSPIKSQEKCAIEVGISRRSVGRILKHNHYHPYKCTLTQGLCEENIADHLEFCSSAIEKIEDNSWNTHHIAFGDEAIFHLNGSVNRHNCQYYASKNPNWFSEVNI